MHRTLLISGLLLASTFAHAAETASQPLTGCAAKRQAIATQIEAAKAQGNSHRQAGLEKALKEVEEHCTDATLRAEREADVAKAEQKVSEREEELREAQAKGEPDKIAKRQSKLQEARAALQQARAELGK